MEKIEQEQTLRTEIYLLMSTLFRNAPSAELLSFLSSLEVETSESGMQKAWVALREAAQSSQRESLDDEYQNLFIGIGRGEVVPFGSWHLTGSLMEKPLAEIRKDLERLGFERQESVKEPEDHIAALCEVMAMLMTEENSVQQAFFNKHISAWFESLNDQINQAKSAQFYLAVAQLSQAFLTLEQVRFSEKTKSSKSLKIDVKNLADYQ